MDIKTQEKYRGINYTQNVLFIFWNMLLLAQFYSQKGYDNYYVNYVEGGAFALCAGYGLFQCLRNKGIYRYISEEVAPIWKWRSKTAKVLFFVASALALGFVVARFFLPPHIVYCLQNLFYVGAFLVPIVGLIARPTSFIPEAA